uniref:Uncharacterized protein n=1 Tax=Knipowitschia caucasica TaxID=637954 RepID=A0AAV2JMA8_KNICA
MRESGSPVALVGERLYWGHTGWLAGAFFICSTVWIPGPLGAPKAHLHVCTQMFENTKQAEEASERTGGGGGGGKKGERGERGVEGDGRRAGYPPRAESTSREAQAGLQTLI